MAKLKRASVQSVPCTAVVGSMSLICSSSRKDMYGALGLGRFFGFANSD